MAERKVIDWEMIEREYRAGQLSTRQIAKQADVSEAAIRKRAKAHGWDRDLSEQVRAGVRSRLVRNDVRTVDVREAVEVAVRRGVEVVRQHQSSLGRATGLVLRLLDELEESTARREDIDAAIEAETAGDKTTARRTMMQRAVSLPSRASSMRDLSTALARLLPLERQAFNLDAGDGNRERGSQHAETYEQLESRRNALQAELAALDSGEGGI
jgi:hypothetical protein